MSAIDPRFRRELLRLVRAEPRHRRADLGTRVRRKFAFVPHLFALTMGTLLVGVVPDIKNLPAPRLAATVILWLAIGFVAGALRQSLERDPHLLVLSLLPVSDRDVLSRQFRKGIRASWKTLVSVALGIGWATWTATGSVATALLAAVGFACAFPPLAVAIALASLRWRAVAFWLHSIILVAIPGAIAGFASPALRAGIAAFLDRHGDAIAATFPTGWLVLPWNAWTHGGPRLPYLAALPLPLVLATLPALVAWLRESYRFRESVLLSAFGEVPEDAPAELVEAMARAADGPRSRGETSIVDDLLARRFLADRLPAPTAWIERWVWRWWTPRQRLCAGFLSPQWPRWTRLFQVSLGLATAALGVGWAIRAAGNDLGIAVWTGGGAVAALVGLPFVSGFGRGFRGIPQGNQILSPFLWQPVAFGEIAVLLLKPIVVRTLVMLPACVGLGALVAWILGEPVGTGALIGLQVALLPLAVFPLQLTAGFRTGLSTYRRSLAGWIAGGIYLFACLANPIAVFFLAIPWVGLATLPALLLLDLAQLALLRRLLRTGKLDALRPPHGQRAVTTV